MIQVNQLARQFSRPANQSWWRRSEEIVHAVRNVSFTAENGQITGLLGANGAGKTTTLRMIAALLRQDSGQIFVDGEMVEAGQQSARTAQARMGVLTDARGLYPRLTARENICYYGVLHGLSRDAADERASYLGRELGMTALLDRRCEGFSQGEKMKAALARALVHDPQNIILDEPTNGLDVMATRALREFLSWLRTAAGGNKCIIFSTHIMQEVERLCDHVVIIADGITVTEGTVAGLLAEAGSADFEDAFVRLALQPIPSGTSLAVAGKESP